jgi:hypothetical protein
MFGLNFALGSRDKIDEYRTFYIERKKQTDEQRPAVSIALHFSVVDGYFES